MSLRARLRKLRWQDALFWGALLALIALRAPTWVRSYQQEGKTVPTVELTLLDGKQKRLLFEPNLGKQAVMFWASWCAPCQLELKRLATAVSEGDIPAEKILAVSIDSTFEAYRTAALDRNYPFPTAWDSGPAAKGLAIEATPTTLHFSPNGSILYSSTGASWIGPWRMMRFLRP
jgi:thiol-disulfide isomerase/thioredoxin